jgi:DNA-binding response OmpR family regulator
VKIIHKWQGFDAGADDYITKPIKPKLLVRGDTVVASAN